MLSIPHFDMKGNYQQALVHIQSSPEHQCNIGMTSSKHILTNRTNKIRSIKHNLLMVETQEMFLYFIMTITKT